MCVKIFACVYHFGRARTVLSVRVPFWARVYLFERACTFLGARVPFWARVYVFGRACTFPGARISFWATFWFKRLCSFIRKFEVSEDFLYLISRYIIYHVFYSRGVKIHVKGVKAHVGVKIHVRGVNFLDKVWKYMVEVSSWTWRCENFELDPGVDLDRYFILQMGRLYILLVYF